MSCELCGTEDAPMRAKVEGVEMQVCERCSAYGTLVKRAPPVHAARTRAMQAPPSSRAPDVMERIDPRAPAMLRTHREKSGLTQEEFARRLRIRLSTYHHYENGSVTPSIADARAIEHAIGVRLVLKERVAEETSQGHVAGHGMTLGDFVKR